MIRGKTIYTIQRTKHIQYKSKPIKAIKIIKTHETI